MSVRDDYLRILAILRDRDEFGTGVPPAVVLTVARAGRPAGDREVIYWRGLLCDLIIAGMITRPEGPDGTTVRLTSAGTGYLVVSGQPAGDLSRQDAQAGMVTA